MLIYAITFLLFSGVLSVVIEQKCTEKIRDACDWDLIPTRYPDTTEELDSMCRDLTTYGKCTLPLLRECGEQKDVEFIENLVEFLETLCNKENPSYKAITSDLTCVVDAYRSAYAGACFDRISEEKEAAVDEYKDDLREKGLSERDVFKCLEAVWENACTAALVNEKCGSLAGDAVLDISVNIDRTLTTTCSEEVLADLPAIAEGLLMEENILENLIRRRK